MKVVLQYFFLVLSAYCLLACADSLSADKSVEKDMVLYLSAVPVNHLVPDSKSVEEIIDEGLNATYVISDFWIFQYNSKGALIGKPTYYRTKGETSQQVSVLLPSEPGPQNGYITVILANTHNNSLVNKIDYGTLAALAESCEIVTSSSDLYQAGHKDLLMNGSVLVTSDAESISCQLYRNVARVDVNISNAASSGIRITSVQLKSVSNKLYYADHMHDGVADFPNTSSVTFVDLEKDEVDIHPGQHHSLKYYLPRNMRGSADSDAEYDKNSTAPSYSTYVEVMAVHVDRNTPVRYRFYLGKNNEDNYDIEPNYLYDIDFNFNSMGTGNDLRVEDLSEVVFADANSYMIHPVADLGIKYTVPIKDRINKFWQSSEGKINSNWNSYTINGTNEWIAEVIWQDIDKQVVKFCNEDGSLTDTYEGGRTGESFSIVTTNAAVGRPCNVVIGVRSAKDGWDPFNDGYMWSWHIWLTNYDPDSNVGGWVEGKYAYQVPGGNLHKYAAFEEIQMYDGKFMMDRNLGSTMYNFQPYSGITQEEVKAASGMYYAYGRKDPFPGVRMYDIKGVAKVFDDGSGNHDVYGVSIQFGPAAIYASVIKPFNYYKRNLSTGGNDWVVDNKLVGYRWNDLDKNESESSTKTFFDPCPPGWKLPDAVAFSSMGYTDKVYASNCVSWTDVSQNKELFDKYKGWLVYLSGESGWESKSGDVAYFPGSSNRPWASGILPPTLTGTGGLWTATPLRDGNARYLYYDNNTLYFFHYDRPFYRYLAFPVRCIQE